MSIINHQQSILQKINKIEKIDKIVNQTFEHIKNIDNKPIENKLIFIYDCANLFPTQNDMYEYSNNDTICGRYLKYIRFVNKYTNFSIYNNDNTKFEIFNIFVINNIDLTDTEYIRFVEPIENINGLIINVKKKLEYDDIFIIRLFIKLRKNTIAVQIVTYDNYCKNSGPASKYLPNIQFDINQNINNWKMLNKLKKYGPAIPDIPYVTNLKLYVKKPEHFNIYKSTTYLDSNNYNETIYNNLERCVF
jgi:hypothetical protein